MAKFWKSVDLTPEMIRKWFNYLRPRVGYSPYHCGAFITDWNGERTGLWYSVRDWQDKGSATPGGKQPGYRQSVDYYKHAATTKGKNSHSGRI